MARRRKAAEPAVESAAQTGDNPSIATEIIPPPSIDPLVPLDLPESVTLAAPHGYIDDDDVNHHWHAGTVVTDAKEIADLMARKAPLEGITHED